MSGMNHWADLQQALNCLRERTPKQAGPVVEERVLAAFRARRRRFRQVRARWAGAAACVAVAVGWLWIRPGAPSIQKPPGPEAAYYAGTAGFVVLPYAESGVPMEEAVIVRVNLRPSELGSLGVPVALAHGDLSIRADLLVGQDGIARAIRFVE